MAENNEPNVTDGFDKFMAAMMAIFVMLVSVAAILIGFSIVISLWQAGIVNSLIVIVIFVAVFAVARKLYHYILEKDFL